MSNDRLDLNSNRDPANPIPSWIQCHWPGRRAVLRPHQSRLEAREIWSPYERGHSMMNLGCCHMAFGVLSPGPVSKLRPQRREEPHLWTALFHACKTTVKSLRSLMQNRFLRKEFEVQRHFLLSYQIYWRQEKTEFCLKYLNFLLKKILLKFSCQITASPKSAGVVSGCTNFTQTMKLLSKLLCCTSLSKILVHYVTYSPILYCILPL